MKLGCTRAWDRIYKEIHVACVQKVTANAGMENSAVSIQREIIDVEC